MLDNLFRKKSGLSTASMDELQQEVLKREINFNTFPLHIFHQNLKPYIQELECNYNIPRSFIGLSLLTSLSSAIGGAVMVSTNGKDRFPLTFYSALVGMTSSAKSLTLDKTFSALVNIQGEFNEEWKEKTKDLKPMEIEHTRMKTLMYRDSHLVTLMRSVLPENPKGVTRLLEELIEWINSMNALSKKEGTDEQVWLSIWDGKSYDGIRSGKQKFFIPKPFVNVIGGIQYAKLKELFKNDRGFSGFISRILFAIPDADQIPLIDPNYFMPDEFSAIIDGLQKSLYYDLRYESYMDEPCIVRTTREANNLYHSWVKKNTIRINSIPEFEQRELEASVFGKMKNYILRIGAVLAICDRYFSANKDLIVFRGEEKLTELNMTHAIECAEYFTKSAIFVALYAKKETLAPPEALQMAALTKAGKSYQEIAKIMYGNENLKQKAYREIKRLSALYPKTFNAQSK
jgi:hypothetical protein